MQHYIGTYVRQASSQVVHTEIIYETHIQYNTTKQIAMPACHILRNY